MDFADIDSGEREATNYEDQGSVCYSHGEHVKAQEHYEKALAIRKEIGDREGEGEDYRNLGKVLHSLGEYFKAIEFFRGALAIRQEIGDKRGEGADYADLAVAYQSLGDHAKAIECAEKARDIAIFTGNKEGKAAAYEILATSYQSLGKYNRAKKYLEKTLTIRNKIGDKAGVVATYRILGRMFLATGEYAKGEECLENARPIARAIGDNAGVAADYEDLGNASLSRGQYAKAKKYIWKARVTRQEIGDRKSEATDCGNLGVVYHFMGEHLKAKEYLEEALVIRNAIGGDKAEKATDHGNLGNIFLSLGEYVKAKEHLEKAIETRKEIGDREGEATDYVNLGKVYLSLHQHLIAKDYLEMALAIRNDIGDKKGIATVYANLGNVFLSRDDEHLKAKEYVEGALAIRKEIGDEEGEGTDCKNLGTVYQSMGELVKAKEYIEKGLFIKTKSGDKAGEAECLVKLGIVFHSLGKIMEAKQHFELAAAISKQIGDRKGEAAAYGNLASTYLSIGDNVNGKKFFQKTISIYESTGDGEELYKWQCKLALANVSQGNIKEAFELLFSIAEKNEKNRNFLFGDDLFNISHSELHTIPFQVLSFFFCAAEDPPGALSVVELGRARALADLMVAQYSVKNTISVNPQSWLNIEGIMRKERNCVCLYISYYAKNVYLWILKTSGNIHFERVPLSEDIVDHESLANLKAFLSQGFRNPLKCEHQSLSCMQAEPQSSLEQQIAVMRLVEDDDDEIQDPIPSHPLLYKLIISPVAHLLKEPEIIIVPDRSWYKVPFAALVDENGKYLSDTHRIRIVPSLTTLNLIQDSPADYHSQTGALIVGDPKVGRVLQKGYIVNIKPLLYAREEAEEIGQLLGVQPLLGQHATKQAVLKMIHSVSLIHFAAHGNAERGEIYLSPRRSSTRIPQEEDYFLTMSDISRIQLRAKLVVLSCCHSASGQIKAEGVVGIARAFLGSGARSVLVALWALEDKATKKLIIRFYEHLVRGVSASESLHEAMKWMRANSYLDVNLWAPFMLIGDNVTFKF